VIVLDASAAIDAPLLTCDNKIASASGHNANIVVA